MPQLCQGLSVEYRLRGAHWGEGQLVLDVLVCYGVLARDQPMVRVRARVREVVVWLGPGVRRVRVEFVCRVGAVPSYTGTNLCKSERS